MAKTFADNFTYPDGGLAESGTGLSWTDDGTGIDIVTELVRINSTSSGTRGTWTTPLDTNDQEASVSVVDIVNGGQGGVRLRVQGPSANDPAQSAGYEFFFRDSSSTPDLRITKRDAAGVQTVLASIPWDDATDGGGVAFKLTGRVVGDVLTLFINDVQRVTVTDSTFATGKYVGLQLTGLNSKVDDWSAKDYGTVTPPPDPDPEPPPAQEGLLAFYWGLDGVSRQARFHYIGL